MAKQMARTPFKMISIIYSTRMTHHTTIILKKMNQIILHKTNGKKFKASHAVDPKAVWKRCAQSIDASSAAATTAAILHPRPFLCGRAGRGELRRQCRTSKEQQQTEKKTHVADERSAKAIRGMRILLSLEAPISARSGI